MPAKNLERRSEEGIYSHIYNRGVEQRLIFSDLEDYEIFQGFLRDYLAAPQDPESTKKDFTVHGRIFRGTPHQPKNYFNKVILIAYSLRPDHFHLLLYQKTPGSIESFIRSLCTRYSIYFNKKYQRTGALFEGPYKSVQIKDEPRLLNLTRYLHHTGSYSSYAEYLGTRVTSWVNPNVVLSFLGQGTGGYKAFVEKVQLDQREKELLEGITFEGGTEHLERSIPEKVNTNSPEIPKVPETPAEKIYLKPNPLLRISEFLGLTIIFFLLTAIGVTNITVAATENPSPSSIASVLSAAITKSPYPSPVPSITKETKTKEPEITPAEMEKPKIILTIKAGNGPSRINIRQKPALNSKTVGKARNGDTFELVSEDSGWYGIKSADGSTGYISSKYIKVGETINK